MKRVTWFAVVAALSALAFSAVASETHSAGVAKQAGPQTITGELVDTGCYLGRSARGEKHIGCATKCISNGMPMGLLTPQGKLYLITLNHDNPDPYNKIKDLAGKTLSITGMVNERSGMTGIDMTDFKLAAAQAGK